MACVAVRLVLDCKLLPGLLWKTVECGLGAHGKLAAVKCAMFDL